MASESGLSDVQLRENEVLLYKDGDPVLKVERGTPLTVIKMLYNADPKNKGTVIAALKPHTDDPLPCLVTLDKSTLTQEKYDIIAFEQPKPQRFPEYQLAQPVIAMGPGSHPQGATMIHTAAGWPPGHTAGLTYAPVSQLPGLQNHMTLPADHPNMIGTNSKQMMHLSHSMSYVAAPVISNVMSNAGIGPTVSASQMGAFTSILPRKSPLTLKPSTTPSRRKRSGHKTAFPRKITLCVPDHVTESPGVNVKKFMYPKSRMDSKDAMDEMNDELEKPNSTVPCDSTDGIGHEDGEIPSPPKADERTSIVSRHQRLGIESSPSSDQSHEEHPAYHGHRSDDSSNEHDSSLGESDGRPVNIDSDERESFSAGNDSDTNMATATQSGIVSLADHGVFRGGEVRVDSDESTGNEEIGVRFSSSRHSRDDVRFVRAGYRSEGDYTQNGSNPYPTTIVRLENTVRIKTEPVERGGHADDEPCEREDYPTNGMPMDEGHPEPMENEASRYLPSSSVRSGSNHEEGASLHPGTPRLPGSSMLPSGLTPYPPNYPRTSADGVAFRCEQCLKEFDTSAALERHRRSHSGERPYKCKICGWGFNLSGNLNQHMAIHQKVKPFKCVYCGKTFARSNVLKAHVRCHTGERPYQCDLCGAKFIISHNLKKHLLNRHQVVWEDRRWPGKGQS